MALHVIVGAGRIGSTAATILAERGDRVRVVTRRGTGPRHPAIELVAADASDAARLSELTAGAAALYNCANPQYDRWLSDWPPLASALLTAAERSGAPLVVMGSLYGYGPVDGPMTEETPLAATHPKLRLRADMWRDALAAQEAGRVRVTEVRASDYIEAMSIITLVMGAPLLAGRRAYVPAALDVPHTWTSTMDAARTLVAAAGDDRSWGRAWHVPSHPPLTVRELAVRFAAAAGAPTPKVSELPYPVLWAAGLFQSFIRELRTTRYQFVRPFVMDSTAATEAFGLKPRPLDESLRDAAESVRATAR